MGRSLAVAALLVLSAAAAPGYEVVTVQGKARRWPSWRATIHTDPAMAADRAKAIRAAAASWTAIDGSAFRFHSGGDSPSAQPGTLSDGNNDVVFRTGLPPFVYAWTQIRSIGADILEADVTFNEEFEWTTDGSPEGAADVETVALHELGHVLGLMHEETAPSVMHSTADASIPNRTPYPDDEAGAGFLYPSAGGPGDPGDEDPDVAAESMEVIDGVPRAGGRLTVKAVVENLGPFSCPPFPVVATLSPGAVDPRDEAIGTATVPLLAGSTATTATFGVLLPASTPPGTYRIGLLADPADTLADRDRDNNVVASAPFTVERPPGAMALGDSVDAPLGPLGSDAADLWIGAGTEVTVRARGSRGVRPALRVLGSGGTETLAEAAGARAATLRWTAPSDGTYRLEFSNAAGGVGRVRVATAGLVRVRGLAAEAPGVLPFPAYAGGTVVLSVIFDGPASPLACRPPAGADLEAPGAVRGGRSRLGPLEPVATGIHDLVLEGSGTARCSILSRTSRRGALLVR